MQQDGNLCVYDSNSAGIWCSYTNGRGTAPYKLIMQTDGNLVIYDSTNKFIWDTKTNTNSITLVGSNCPRGFGYNGSCYSGNTLSV